MTEEKLRQRELARTEVDATLADLSLAGAQIENGISDALDVPLWYTNIKSVEWRSQPPLRLGSRIAFVAEFLGKRLAYTYEVVELMPDERLVMRTVEGPFPMETTYTWASTGRAVLA